MTAVDARTPPRVAVAPAPPAADAALAPLLTLLQLGRRARAAATPQELAFVMVNETLQLLPYRQAALWNPQGLPQLAALSGLPQVDAQTPYAQGLAGLCRHLLREGTAAGPLPLERLPGPWRDEAAQWLPAHLFWLPLAAPAAAATPAVLLLAREAPWSAADTALLGELAEVYGHAWAGWAPRRGLAQRGWDALRQRRARRWLAVAALAVAVLPVRLTVLAPAEVVPRDAFMVRAPWSGVIERFDVRPNQAVQAGDSLFTLDTTELRTRLELARKAHDTALEEYRQAVQMAVTSDKHRAEVALRRGRLQERAVELDHNAAQLERVQVKAERAGTAVFADANDWVGKAVNLGERVLLLADPAQVELAAWLPAADLIELHPGDRITLYPHGDAFASFEAQVQTVAYRAEPTAEGVMAYRIKATFATDQAPPRIGQLGTVHLHGGWAPLVYALLRRPLVSARQWLGG